MKIGILVCGHLPPELVDKYRGYDQLFKNLLGKDAFDYHTFDVLDGEIPKHAGVVDGWLITGSKHGVYEDHPWIPPLESLLREAYSLRLPTIGVCFGHQILAQALGGKVEKFKGGWAVGPFEYTLSDSQGSDQSGDQNKGQTAERSDDRKYAAVNAFHQDQIVKLPENATSYGSNDFCRYAFVNYGDKAMSMQPHPEFDDEFLEDLLAARGDSLPADIRNQAQEKLGLPLTSHIIGEQMKAFFLQKNS